MLRWLGKTPVHIILIVVGLAWLVPTIGLFVTSIIGPEYYSEGWWKIFSAPSRATWSNYDAIFSNPDLIDALITTAIVAVGSTLLPILIAALAGYAFAWIDFPGRDWWFIAVIGLLVVPLQMALIPMFQLYTALGIFDTRLSLILYHTAFALPFAIFLLRNFFIGIPKDILESARIDGASRDPHLPAPDPAAGAAGDRVTRHLPVPVDVERPARRAHLRAQHAADHGLDLLAAAPVRRQHRADRARDLHLARDPAGRLLRVPALLRRGTARRLGEVSTALAERSIARGPPGSRRTPRRTARCRSSRRTTWARHAMYLVLADEPRAAA